MFTELVGQEHVVRALSNALDNDRVHHAYLFSGTRGVGKTTLARILAKSLNCETGVSSQPCGQCASCREIDEGRFVDLLEVDAASRTKVDQTRELLENVPYAPVSGRYKVYLIDEVHMFSDSSFNALLKTLEEPPPHVKFLLATTDPQKVPVTVLSRCLQFNLKRLPLDQIQTQLDNILQAEQISAEPAALQLLALAADGSMRDALSLLDQAIVFGAGQVREADVRAMLGTVSQDHVVNLLRALQQGDGAALIQHIEELAQQSVDFQSLLNRLLASLHKLAIMQMTSVSVFEDDHGLEQLKQLAASLAPEDVQLYYQMALVGQQDLSLAPDPRMGFEMLLLRMLAFKPDSNSGGQKRSASSTQTPATQTRAAPAGAGPRSDSARPASAAASTDKAPATAKAERPVAPGGQVAAGSDWTTVVADLNLGGMSAQFAGHCAVKSWQDNHLILTLDPMHQQLKGSMAEDRLCQALSQRFDKLRIEIVVEKPLSCTPEQQRARQLEQKHSDAVDEIHADAFVQAVQKTFDAEVIQESIKPTTH